MKLRIILLAGIFLVGFGVYAYALHKPLHCETQCIINPVTGKKECQYVCPWDTY